MVSTAWVAGKLNPYTRWAKLALVLLAVVGLFSAGWMTNGWRLGEAQAKAEVVRVSALNERQQKAMAEALELVTDAHRQLQAARKANAELSRKAAEAAPKAPEYACRDLPLPEDYLETYRK